MKKIRRISIVQLFNLFDHEILLSAEDNVTIIHGTNGIGKTTILKLIKAIFDTEDEIIFNAKYKEIDIDFFDDSKITITKMPNKHNKEKQDLKYKIINGNNKPIEFKREYQKREKSTKMIRILNEHIVNNISETIEPIHLSEIFLNERNNHFSKMTEYIKYLKQIRKWINIDLIETQRLYILPSSHSDRGLDKLTLQVQSYAEDIKKAINDKLAESATKTQALDRSFPMRLLSGDNEVFREDEILDKLALLEQKRARYTAAGLLDEEADSVVPKSISDHERMVLSVYVKDAEQKLDALEDLSNKIELLKKIINQRFQYKRLEVSKENGLTFKATQTGEELLPSELSSGEQHELVLFYQLLFKIGAGSLIMIDEPELSLHVVWQHEFLQDLIKIASLGNLDVIIATHSPQIINDRWDLTVELRGPNE